MLGLYKKDLHPSPGSLGAVAALAVAIINLWPWSVVIHVVAIVIVVLIIVVIVVILVIVVVVIVVWLHAKTFSSLGLEAHQLLLSKQPSEESKPASSEYFIVTRLL